MKRKTKIAVAIALAGLLGVLACLLTRRDEGPLYDGKTVSYWLAHPIVNQDTNRSPTLVGATRGRGVLEFPKFDSNAVPYMVRALEKKDSTVKLIYMRAREKSPQWVRKVTPELVPAQLVKRNTLVALGQMGPEANVAVPAMVKVIQTDQDPIIGIAAVVNLGRFNVRDKEVRIALEAAANSTNSAVANFARDALRRDDYQINPF